MRREPADAAVRAQAANDIHCNVFLDAGAGCGKTRALTDRYLRLLESGLDVHQIVAVTFTNKAARDMKARLRQRCEERGRVAHTPAEATLWRRRARELESAPISTIHAFCRSILSRHAIAAEIDPHFQLLDELQLRLLLKQSLRQTLLQRLDAEESTTALLVSELGLKDALEGVEKLVSTRDEWEGVLAKPPSAADLLAQWEQLHVQVQDERLQLLMRSSQWRQCIQMLQEHPADDPTHPLEVQRQECLQCVQEAAQATSYEAQVKPLQRMLAIGRTSAKKGGWNDDAVRTIVSKVIGELKNASGKIGKLLPDMLDPWDEDDEATSKAAALTSALLVEGGHALQAFTEAKLQEAKLDFDDLEILVRDLLRDNPRVRHDCHERYRHMLIDEFQDTNQLQKELLWLAAGAEPGQDPPPGRLFVVGDAKQSIYRFRDADVTVFDATREQFERSGAGCERLRLQVTFRAHPATAAVQNALFLSPVLMGPNTDDRAPYEAFYECLEAHRDCAADGAHCELLLVVDSGPPAAGKVQALREAEALALAEWIKQALETMQVYEQFGDQEVARRARPGDFALLFRAMRDVRLYERALRLHGIEYHISAGRGFFARQEVLDVLSLLSALENQRDEIALAGALRSPLFALSDETLYWLKPGRGELYKALQLAAEGQHTAQAQLKPGELDLIRYAWREISTLRELKNRLPLSALLGEIINRTGYTAALAGLFGGNQMVSNVRKLIELARGFEAGASYSLRDFVDYLHELRLNEERMAEAPVEEEEADCVKLMTIHAAKGLEWPVVIVPDLVRPPGVGASSGWRYHRRYGLVAAARSEDDERVWPALGKLLKELDAAEDEAERRRLLYVALTRCRDRLLLSSGMGGKANWLAWLLDTTKADFTKTTCAVPGIEVRAVQAEDLQAPQPRLRAAADETQMVSIDTLRRRVAPIALDLSTLRRFTVTGLSMYRHCPACYQLRFLQGLPEQRATGSLPQPESGLSALERGLLVHRTLEIIGSRGLQAAGEALTVALKVGRLAESDRARIMNMLEWYLHSDLYQQRVKPAQRLRSEMPIAFSLGDVLLEGKIDALAEHPDDQVVVLDYKTGFEQDESSRDEHRFQVGLYCAGLELLGKRVQMAAIVYLDTQTVVELIPAEMAAAYTGASEAIAGIRNGQFGRGEHSCCEDCRLGWVCSEV